jgi:hypothetical protein
MSPFSGSVRGTYCRGDYCYTRCDSEDGRRDSGSGRQGKISSLPLYCQTKRM